MLSSSIATSLSANTIRSFNVRSSTYYYATSLLARDFTQSRASGDRPCSGSGRQELLLFPTQCP
jgi:hypothetical protein